MTPQPSTRGETSAPKRRPYKAPALTEYGPVAKITEAMLIGSKSDGGPGLLMMRQCL